MKTLADIKRLADKVGASVEEDTGYREMRVFQLVAPARMVWHSDDIKCKRIEWATGSSPHAIASRETEFHLLTTFVELGVREMSDSERELYDE